MHPVSGPAGRRAVTDLTVRFSAIAAFVIAVGVVLAVFLFASPSKSPASPAIRPLPQNFFRP
jgi:hypothetical protein